MTQPRKLRYHVRKILDYLHVIMRPDDRIVEVNPTVLTLAGRIYPDTPRLVTDDSGSSFELEGRPGESASQLLSGADYVVIRNSIHRCYDIAKVLESISQKSGNGTKIVVVYYSAVWKPVIEWFWGKSSGPMNWIAPEDLENLAKLSGLETVSRQSKILLPINIPGVSYLVNRFLAPLAGFNLVWVGAYSGLE